MTEFPQSQSLLFVISGPAGSGKTTLCNRITDTIMSVIRVITSTTRPPREGETNGIDYHFMSPEQYQDNLTQNNFLEHATVHGNSYGTLRTSVTDHFNDSTDLILNIDVQGAASIQKAAQTDPLLQGRTVFIFVSPDSINELEARLNSRGKDNANTIAQRLENATKELESLPMYDYFIPSTSKEKDFQALLGIYHAEKLRIRN